MKLSAALRIASTIGKFMIKRYQAKASARANLREALNEYQVERYNAELRERVAGKVPYDASIHEESMKHQAGRNPTTRINIKPSMKGEQGS